MNDNPVQVLVGDCRTLLRELSSESVQCCVTSPPYWGLRDYGTAAWEGGDAGCDHKQGRNGSGRADGIIDERGQRNRDGVGSMGGDCGKCGAKRIDSQLGLERTPDEYVAKMVAVFREVKRVLRHDGTLWLNLGDSYAAQRGGTWMPPQTLEADAKDYKRGNESANVAHRDAAAFGLKHKDLCGIPWRVAFALQADGWWLRSDIIWAKPNPMPESVTDRPTKSHEYLFLLTKSANYFYDSEAIKEPQESSSIERARYSIGFFPKQDVADHTKVNYINRNTIEQTRTDTLNGAGRNKRSVWTVATAPYPEAHFATYPPDLIKPCIMAGTSAKGCCARCGAPWERIVERTSYERNHTDPKKLGTLEHHQSRGSGGNEGMIRSGAAWNEFKAENPDKTLGWQPTCKCDAAVQPCVVLDPFAGSGTTGAVALELGRKAVLIELNPKYASLIEQRTSTTMGLALA